MHLIVNDGETHCSPTNTRDAVQTLLAIKRCKEKNGSGRDAVWKWEKRDDCETQTEEPDKT